MVELGGPVPTDVIKQVFVFPLRTDKSFPRAVVTPEDQVVLKNEEAQFHCQFTAVPPPTLEWYHEKELVANKTRYVESSILPLLQHTFLCHRTQRIPLLTLT